MIDSHMAGHDIVYGVRRSRNADTLFKRLTAKGYYRTSVVVAQPPRPTVSIKPMTAPPIR